MTQYVKVPSDTHWEYDNKVKLSWVSACIFLRSFMLDKNLCEVLIANQEAQHSNQFNRKVEFVQNYTKYIVSVYDMAYED